MHIELMAVDSKYATPEALDAAGITPDQIPPKWRLMAHQAATIKAIRHGDAPIIVNQAMTGDGKSLAGQFQLFSERDSTFLMFPTNELALDQQRSLDRLLANWTPPRWTDRRLRYAVINAAKLDELQERYETLNRPELLVEEFGNRLILTNPDIFSLIMSFGYNQHGVARDRLLADLSGSFRLFVFDEFHLFGAPQSAAVLTAMLLIRELQSRQRPTRFLFLSATPQQLLTHLANRIGLPVTSIEGEYQHGLPETPDGYRRILQPATLHLYPTNLEEWVQAHIEDVILPFFREHSPGAKGVLIANSVASAHRVYRHLYGPCIQHGIQLGINTGLTPRAERTTDADLLVATSTVDVGVDFRVNFIAFESMDSATHMQRLGRLGRHTDDGAGHPFTRFEAHAMLPAWVVESLTAAFPAGSTVSRQHYRETLEGENAYPPLQDFAPYIKQWGGVQAAHVLNELRKPEIRTQYAETHERLKEQYRVLYRSGAAKYRSLIQAEQHATLSEVRSFRGGSPFTALVQQMDSRTQEFVSYNLITLLLNGELEYIPAEDADALIVHLNQDFKALRRSQPLGVFRLHGWLPKPRPVSIHIDDRLGPEHLEAVIELARVQLVASGVPGMHYINRELETRVIPAFLTQDDSADLRRKLRLGYQLEMFNFTSIGTLRGTVLFARDALLIDSVLWRRKNPSSSKDDPIIH